MKHYAIALLLLSACGPSGEREQPEESAGPAVEAAVPPAPATTKAVVLAIPDDKAQLERLVAMGYKMHEDHLDPPGVASCPKMAENPVM